MRRVRAQRSSGPSSSPAASSLAGFLGPAAGVGGAAASVLLNTLVIAGLFKLMVERDLSWTEIRLGAFVGGIGSGRVSLPPLAASREDFAVDAVAGDDEMGRSSWFRGELRRQIGRAHV